MRACSSGVSFGISRSGSSAGIAGRLRAERVEPRVEVAVHPDRLDERHRRGDAAEQLLVGDGAGTRAAEREPRQEPAARPAEPERAGAVPRELEQPREARLRREDGGGIALEEVAPLLRHRAGVVEVLLEKKRGVARVRAVDLRASHSCPVVAAAAGLPERVARRHGEREPEEEADAADQHGRELKPPLRHPRRDERDDERRDDETERVPEDPEEADEDRERREVAGDGLRRASASAGSRTMLASAS